MNSRLTKYVKTKFLRLAEDLMENPQGLKFKLDSAAQKLDKKNVSEAFGIYLDDLKALIRMSKLWVTRKYTQVDQQTILYSIVAVVYFLTPTDFVPDFIIGLGFLDDIAVLTWVLGLIKTDLDKFKQWEKGKGASKSSPKTTGKKKKV